MKLALKESTREQLEASNLVLEEIRNKELKVKQMKEERKRREQEMKVKWTEYWRERDEQQDDMWEVEREAAALERSPDFRTEEQTKVLKDRLKEIDDLSAALELGKTATSCPICYHEFDEVYSCQTCYKSICKGCNKSVEDYRYFNYVKNKDGSVHRTRHCPFCKQDVAVKPLLRNKAAEELMDF